FAPTVSPPPTPPRKPAIIFTTASADADQSAVGDPTSAADGESSSEMRMAFANDAASPAGTSRFAGPEAASSGTPPTRLATNGVPHASDSRSTLGIPFDRLGRTVRSAARYQSGNSAGVFNPANWTTAPN